MPNLEQSYHHRPNLMVTGASGNLGHWICRMARKDWTVSGIYSRHPFSMEGVEAFQTDLTCQSEVERLFARIKPRAVIHAAAVSLPAVCERSPQATSVINVSAPGQLAAICADERIPFVLTSTDLVFNGLKAPYGEQDTANPVCVYGRQKVQAEELVLNRYGDALVCRMPLMIGVGPRMSSSFCMQMLSDIRHNRTVNLFTDEFRTPVDYQSAAQGLLKMIGNARGILHLGGKTRVSRFELGLSIAKQMKIVPTMLNPIAIDALALNMERSPDCSLKSNVAFALGYDPLSLPMAVKRIIDQLNMITDT